MPTQNAGAGFLISGELIYKDTISKLKRKTWFGHAVGQYFGPAGEGVFINTNEENLGKLYTSHK